MIQEKYNIQKENLIFVKDTLGDIREADIAGVSTIAVTWGAHDEAYFTKESHGNLLKIVDSMEHLESTIEEYFQ